MAALATSRRTKRGMENPKGLHLPIYSVSITQAKSVPSRGHGFVGLGNARKAAAKEGSQFIAQVKDSHLKHVVYLIPPASFSVHDLDAVVRAPGGGFGAHESNPGRHPKLQVIWHVSNTEEQSKEDATESAARMKGMGAGDVSVVKTRHQYKDYYGFTKSGMPGYAHKGWKYGVKFRPTQTVNPENPSKVHTYLEAIRGSHYMGDDASTGLSSYHAAKAAVDAGRIKEPMKRLSAVRAALKSHRVTVSLDGDRVRVHRPDTGATFYVGAEEKRNPESSSESMYESFHGTPSTETLEYEQSLHYHGNLAALGELIELKVNLLSGDKAVLTFDAGEGDGQSENPRSTRRPTHLLKKATKEQIRVATDYLKKRYREHLEKFPRTGESVNESQYVKVNLPYTLRNMMEGVGHWADLQEQSRQSNPFWPFSSFTKSTIYHVGSGRKYGVVGTHKGYSIYKHSGDGDVYFMVPKLDPESRLDSKKDAEKFIESWVKARKNPYDDSDSNYSGFGKYAYSVYWGINRAQWPMANGYYRTRKEAEERAKLERRKTGHKYAVKKVEHRAYNPKHRHGPFHEAGKLLGKGSSVVSKPMDQFTDVVGKVGGYLDDQVGRVLNPGHDPNNLWEHVGKLVGREKANEMSHMPDNQYIKETAERVLPKRSAEAWAGTARFPAERKDAIRHFTKGFKYGFKGDTQRNPEVPSASAVLLTSNEHGTQLYLVGGDQSLSLSDLNITGPAAEKEHVTIGDITHIVYRTRKDFDKMAETDYIHEFSEDTKGPLPELVYDRLNKRLSLVGGVYFIKQPLTQTSPGIED